MRINIDIPDGISGDWKVESFTVSEEDANATRLRAIFHGGRGYVPAGNYKNLKRGGELIMSNTPDEIDDFLDFVYEARGSVLVNGLGLGVLLKALLNKPEVTEVLVIEKSQDVINLVAPTYLTDKRVKIVCADAFEYKPEKGKRFNAVWHDIWDAICADNLKEMTILHRKYGRITDYQASWCKAMCVKQNRY